MKMECTQRLECTQELYSSHSEKVLPEQVGFLGICGAKYPLKKGPNKIGRDPQTCSIVLNLNSISRQHAVINILNKQDFMLMDLDSANKTKLESKTLSPYIPHPLRNGDTVQFGDIFGIFRLLEEECDLPMTQAMDIPETPVFIKHSSKLFNAPKTLVPESPDVSDKDESFIIASQKPDTSDFKTPKSHFIKPPGKTNSIRGNKNDNVSWNSKKSLSLNASDISVDNSTISDVDNKKKHDVSNDIHDLETQVPYIKEIDESTDSIYSANTQMPSEPCSVPSIHDMTTQLPFSSEKLPQVCKISNQEDMQCDIFTSNKEKEHIFCAETQQVIVVKEKTKMNSILDAETQVVEHATTESNIHDLETQQIFLNASPESTLFDAATQETHFFKVPPEKVDRCSDEKSKLIEDEILFDDLDSESFEENFESQNILSDNILHMETKPEEEGNNVVVVEPEDDLLSQSQPIKRTNRKVNQIDSDNSTDCEDIDMLPTQQIFDKEEEGDETDCEDVENNLNDIKAKKNVSEPPEEDFNDMATQMLDDEELEHINKFKTSEKVSINEIATQKIDCENTVQKDDFDEAATQIIFDDDIEEIKQKKDDQVFNNFKVPVVSPKKYKKRESITSEKQSPNKQIESRPSTSKEADDEKYYAATQELYEDLCSPKETADDKKEEIIHIGDDHVPCSIEEVIGERFPYLDDSPIKKVLLQSDKSPISDGDEVNKYVSGLSITQINDVVGVDDTVGKLKKIPSDPSDLEDTPKKIKVFKILDADLPNTQEIKINIAKHCVNPETESSSESEMEQETQECTPIVHKIKKKGKAKIDLMKRLNVDSLPTRVITRVRKPVAKLLEGDQQSKKSTERILKPKYMTELDSSIDSEIIKENIRRFKDLKEKSKMKKENNVKMTNNSSTTTDDSKLETMKTEDKKDVQIESRPRRTYKRNNKQDKEQQEKTISPEKESKAKKSETLTVIEKEKSPRSSRRRKEADDKVKSKSEQQNESKSVENDSKPKPTVEKRKRGRPKKDETVKQLERETKHSRHHKKETESHNTSEHQKELKKSESTKTTRHRKEVDKNTEPKRTRRHQKEIEKIETPKVIQTRSILKRSSDKSGFEQSTVYNVSSGSDETVLKRQGSDIYPPSKKSRSMDSSSNKSLRSTPARRNKSHKVLFTAFSLEVLTEVKGKLEKLGAETVTNVTECTVLVTLQIKRTFKLLCAVGLGRPIVGPNWVQACVDSNMIVDPWQYIIKDETAERRFGFSLQRTLTGKRNYLRGWNVTSTPNVLPSAMEMKLIVECSGGTWSRVAQGGRWAAVSCAGDRAAWPRVAQGGRWAAVSCAGDRAAWPRVAQGGRWAAVSCAGDRAAWPRVAQGGRWAAVSCAGDRAAWPRLAQRGALVLSTEFILQGVLKQKLDIEAYRLC